MTFNRPFSQGLGAILGNTMTLSGPLLSRAVYAVIMADTWEPTDYLDTSNMDTTEADVAANLWDGTTDSGGNDLDTPITVTIDSLVVSDSQVTITISDVEFGNCSDEGDTTALGTPGWILFFVEEASVVSDADRYIVGVADFAFTPASGETVTWVSDNTGTFIYKFQ